MLNLFFLSKQLFNYFQSSFYIDYFIKKLAESFVRNVFIYTALFFCEKFLIEYITKKFIDSFLGYLSTSFLPNNFFLESIFTQVLIFLFYFIALLELFYIFF